MKHATLIAAAILGLVANAFALLHAARNRSGAANAEITLTDREFHYYRDKDDSGVTLRLSWVDVSLPPYGVKFDQEFKPWLDKAKLIELGFDCSVPPDDRNAYSFYSRQSGRAAYVALEYNGPAWQKWIEIEKKSIAENTADFYQRLSNTRLLVIDAAPDPATLRARHSQRDRVVIAPAVIRVSVMGQTAPGRPGYLSGHIQEIPSQIHVPRPFSEKFREPGRKLLRDANSEEPLYRVRLRYGSLLEPWVVGVEFPN